MKALIYVIDTSLVGEYPAVKSAMRNYHPQTAVESHDVEINYDIDLTAMSAEEIARLAGEFDILAVVGGYRMYYYVLNRKPPLKFVNVNKAEMLVREFYKSGKTLVAPLAVPAYLAKLGLLAGRDATVYPTTELIKVLLEGKANFVNKPIVKSGNVVTVKNVKNTSEKEFLEIIRETT